MTRILVTGGSGFIGKHLVSALIARGRQVRVLDLQPPPRALPQVQYVRGSVLDRDLVDRAMDGVDEVYHLAGLPGMWVPRKADFHTVNFGGTEIVIETARKRGISASCTARPNPFCSVPRQRWFLSLTMRCCRTTCRVHTRARKCSRTGSPCRRPHPDIRSSSAVPPCRSGRTTTTYAADGDAPVFSQPTSSIAS
jgi:hypothetical protein